MANTGPSSQRASQGAHAAPAPSAGGRRHDLYLLCGDDALLLELGPLLGERYRTRPIDSVEQLDPGSAAPWAMIIDASTRTDARAQAVRV